MYFFSEYCRPQKEENKSSLLLMQVCHRKKRMPILLACVGAEKEPGQGKFLMGRLADWFYGSGMQLCGRKSARGWKKAVEQLHQIAAEGDKGFGLMGILCAGNRFCRFQRGREGAFFLLNTRNNRSNCRRLETLAGGDCLCLEQGSMQRRIGMLLCTSEMGTGFTEEELAQHLNMKRLSGRLSDQHFVQEQLKEFKRLCEINGGKDTGAVFVCVV